jgi:hypothetical protein
MVRASAEIVLKSCGWLNGEMAMKRMAKEYAVGIALEKYF